MGKRREKSIQTEIEITPQMLRAGVAAYFRWNAKIEEEEALVASIYFAMETTKRSGSRE